MTNTRIDLKKYVVGVPDVSANFDIVKVDEVDVASVSLGDHDLVLKAEYLSMDPYMRGRMRDYKGSYFPPFEEGKPLDNFLVARVLKSGSDKFKEGDLVHGFLPWVNTFKFTYKDTELGWPFFKIGTELPPSYYLGVLGMTGLTAWMGLNKICCPKKGETLFVSAASGAVGQVVGQLGKRMGLYVAGCAGSDEKVKLMREKFGYDAAFNYKTNAHDLISAIRSVCPKGVDCYFDNVGGTMLDAVLEVCNHCCRIAACGAISLYNVEDKNSVPGIKNSTHFVFKSIRLQGFIVSDMIRTHGITDAVRDITDGLKDGSITVVEDVAKGGIEEAPKVFCRMLKGDNVGKQILQITA
eukprot:Gregarina_sp_Pseudo_9__1323@NODE_1886_length_1275_cov_92_159385_g1750_i0_p1_GENE_NODE_1886_length_1275_cov_92_159385_g1750_i0NODE_1886_length_1275_cov_92_159385_g1750_i0_p1_ORF_typecomplete_len353_score109_83ADH_N_2/PF16884_5/7_2e27ADH_zinc_N/PF00107_26/4_3e19ADH_zinc_N_2/PF13602_6/1_7e07_NODE_1886_length_1275_cov_92_159385_g1750_i0951153